MLNPPRMKLYSFGSACVPQLHSDVVVEPTFGFVVGWSDFFATATATVEREVCNTRRQLDTSLRRWGDDRYRAGGRNDRLDKRGTWVFVIVKDEGVL